MRQIYLFICSLFACSFTLTSLMALSCEDKLNVKSDLRTLELLPNLLYPLAVDFGVPADFVAQSPEGTADLFDWLYWGPENILKAYFEDPSSLKQPLIRVKLIPSMDQASFHKSFMNLLKMLQQEGFQEFSVLEAHWGDYPVFATNGMVEGRPIFLALVGLNSPETDWNLVFNLVYPDKPDHPNKKDRQLWEGLLMKTTSLKGGDHFKVNGQDLQDGYTLVNIGRAKLTMYAEKRQGDGRLQIVVIPESSDVDFQYVDTMECVMEGNWKRGEPMVKVYGEIAFCDKNYKSTINSITPIFFKWVQNFSTKEDEGKKILTFQK